MRSLTLLFLVAGCAHKPETKSEDKPAAASTATQAPSSAATTNEKGAIASDDCNSVRVHFPYNSAEIDPAELPSLQKAAGCLKADAKLRITIQGHADERGTQEYNLALGDQRAAVVAKYIQSLGASQSQLKTVSFGKENPVCTDHDEACWSQNRRADLKK